MDGAALPACVDVVVIGGGAAGMSAAQRLVRHHGLAPSSVLVLEAGDRLGGRLRQDWEFLQGAPLDVGAEFVHGFANEITALAQAAGHHLRQLFTWSQGDGGPSEEEAPCGGAGYYWVQRRGELMRFDELSDDMVHLHEVLGGVAEASGVRKSEAPSSPHHPASFAAYLHAEGIGGDALDMAAAGYANTAGGRLEELSVHRVAEFEAAWEKDGEEADFRMAGTFAHLVSWLSLGLQARTHCAVTHVSVSAQDSHDAFPVTLRVAMGPAAVHRAAELDGSAAQHSIRAKAVIVTCTPPVLLQKKLTLSPPLSPLREHALRSIALRNGVKVALRFAWRPWPADCMGAVAAGEAIPEMWMNCTQGVGLAVQPPTVPPHAQGLAGLAAALQAGEATTSPASPPASGTGTPPSDTTVAPAPWFCIGFAMGPQADALTAKPPQVVVAAFLSQLTRMFGQHPGARAADFSKAFRGGSVFSWADTPWIGGAYTCPTLQEAAGARALLAAPHADGRVLFAGEATSGGNVEEDSPLTVHGAMRSGIRAANEAAGGVLGLHPSLAAAKL